MKSASGLLFRGGEFIEANITLRNGHPVIQEGPLENPDIEGIILPRPINCHTHLGDAFIERPEKASVEEIVAPPNGLKHRMLANVKPEEQISSMRKAIAGMAALGTSHFMDFREGGIEGARILIDASAGLDVKPVIFGRPVSGYDEGEMAALLDIVDGIGMSAVSDLPIDELEAISAHTRSAKKSFALHASEARHENSHYYLGLKPDLLIHMIFASDHDLAACSEAGVPVAICPTANSFFGLRPPVEKMLAEGITVCLGTDNAMLAAPNLFDEIRFLAANFDLSKKDIFVIALENGRKVLNSVPGLWAAKGQDYLVLENSLDDPWGAVIDAIPEKIRLFDTRE